MRTLDGVTTLINAMEAIDQLGSLRDTVEVVNEFNEGKKTVLLTCLTENFHKTKIYELAIDIEIAEHNDFGKLMLEEFEEHNDPANEEYAFGYRPRCRNPALRSVFFEDASQKSGCDMVPANYNPDKYDKLRFVCALQKTSTVSLNVAMEDASAKVMFAGKLMRGVKSITATDASHGGS